ncbi:peptidoglycan hydrolase-like protein with peptidoglycan-binding domain [Cryobacterium sp. MP_M3]|nr:peptidoglycan hydrolase-like protein with peptidoglycan-binding domain [Cryobacterium sp. MP_M3]
MQNFQSFSALPITGLADFATWASLLISTGDPTRPAKAVDCITTITPTRAQTLVANGITTVGRYLSNTPVADYTDKNIKPGELDTIFSAGLKVFPIFQEGGDGLDAFSYERGASAGYKAHSAAQSYGFTSGTVVYFAVDFDAIEDEVLSNVVPHFQGIRDALAAVGSIYRVGIYGSRNTCTIVSDKQLAVFSFVSDMSSGYSGNLGFPLPKNWTFDQIAEVSIGSGDGQIGIDRDISSGRDAGVGSVSAPALNSTAFAYLDKLQALAVAWATGHPGSNTASELSLQYLRQPQYNDSNPLWPVTAGSIDGDFVASVDASGLTRIDRFVDPVLLRPIRFDHLAAAANGVTYNGLPLSTLGEVNLADLAGWAGDFIQTLGDYIQSDKTYGPYAFGTVYLGNENPLHYPWEDYVEDVDGMNLGVLLRAAPSLSFSAAFQAYFTATGAGTSRTRHATFLARRFGNSMETAGVAALAALIQNDNLIYQTARTAILASLGVYQAYFPLGDNQGLSRAFSDKLAAKLSVEG